MEKGRADEALHLNDCVSFEAQALQGLGSLSAIPIEDDRVLPVRTRRDQPQAARPERVDVVGSSVGQRPDVDKFAPSLWSGRGGRGGAAKADNGGDGTGTVPTPVPTPVTPAGTGTAPDTTTPGTSTTPVVPVMAVNHGMPGGPAFTND